jgi:hypothetical protein
MPYTSITRAQLRVMLQERYTDDPFWTDTDANDALNEAMRYFNLFTGFWRGTSTANTSAGSPFVTVPGSVLTKATRVYVSGRALTRKSILEFYRGKIGWRTQTTASGSPVPTTIREWAPVGLGTIAVWPHTVAGGDTLSFDGVKLTPILTNDAAILDLGNEELSLVLDEALWVLSFKRVSTQGQLQVCHQRFLEGCLERNDQLRQSSYFRRALGLDQQQRLVPARRSATDEVSG